MCRGCRGKSENLEAKRHGGLTASVERLRSVYKSGRRCLTLQGSEDRAPARVGVSSR